MRILKPQLDKGQSNGDEGCSRVRGSNAIWVRQWKLLRT